MPTATTWCPCARTDHDPSLVVVTGGPGAGKTAVLELARRALCEHVAVLPEAAGIVFGGGFPRRRSVVGRTASQRVIAHTERQLEWLHLEERRSAVVLCDRGTLDGLAYWPGAPDDLLAELGSTQADELARYAAVVHLRTPVEGDHYNHDNPLRIEDARTAREIDDRILAIWAGHPRRTVIGEEESFARKAELALDAIRATLPACCGGDTPAG